MTDLKETKMTVPEVAKLIATLGTIAGGFFGVYLSINSELIKLKSVVNQVHEENLIIMNSLKITPPALPSQSYNGQEDPAISRSIVPKRFSAGQ